PPPGAARTGGGTFAGGSAEGRAADDLLDAGAVGGDVAVDGGGGGAGGGGAAARRADEPPPAGGAGERGPAGVAVAGAASAAALDAQLVGGDARALRVREDAGVELAQADGGGSAAALRAGLPPAEQPGRGAGRRARRDGHGRRRGGGRQAQQGDVAAERLPGGDAADLAAGVVADGADPDLVRRPAVRGGHDPARGDEGAAAVVPACGALQRRHERVGLGRGHPAHDLRGGPLGGRRGGGAWAGSVPAGARRAAGSTARSLRFLIGGGSFHTSGGRADRRALTVTRPAARELCGVGPVHRLSTTIRGPPMPRPRRPGPGGRPFYWDGRPPPANFLLRPAAD